MSININLKKFLKNKLLGKKISRETFATQSGINRSTIIKILGGRSTNPNIKTIFKLAKYCNCSMDEVLGREFKYYSSINEYKNVTEKEISNNLKIFFKKYMKKNNLNSFQLTKKISCDQRLIYDLTRDNSKKETISSSVILRFADCLDISIDQIIYGE